MFKKRRRLFFIIPLAVIAFFLLFSYVVMLLWNGVLLPVLHVQMVSFWQAAGILVLSKILFGGFRRGGFGGHRGSRGFNRGAWREKWQNMNEEERAKFKEEWRNRCRNTKQQQQAQG